MESTEREQAALGIIADRVDALREFVTRRTPPDRGAPAADWFCYLAELKAVQGNTHNLSSLAACLMAKEYLIQRLPMAPFDVAEKPQGAPGLDIDAHTIDGRRVVGELKTTVPYAGSRLGAAQSKSFASDVAKLEAAEAPLKFLFVTDPTTKQAVEHAFGSRLRNIAVVCLRNPTTT